MNNYSRDTVQGCATIVALLIGLFVMPIICMTGWNAIAYQFNLPTFTYWNWFFISWGVRWLLKGGRVPEIKKN